MLFFLYFLKNYLTHTFFVALVPAIKSWSFFLHFFIAYFSAFNAFIFFWFKFFYCLPFNSFAEQKHYAQTCNKKHYKKQSHSFLFYIHFFHLISLQETHCFESVTYHPCSKSLFPSKKTCSFPFSSQNPLGSFPVYLKHGFWFNSKARFPVLPK